MDISRKVLSTLMDLGFRGYIDDLDLLGDIDISRYPSFHADVYRALKEGKYELLDINGSFDLGFSDDRNRKYYSLIKVLPFERRLAYVFEYGGTLFALPHRDVARSLDERMSVEGVKDPQEYEKRLNGVNVQDVHVEGYKNETYEFIIPTGIFKNLDTFLKEYTRELKVPQDAVRVGVIKRYYVPVLSSKSLPRAFPSLNFMHSSVLSILNFVVIKNELYIYAFAYSWARAAAFHTLWSRFVRPEFKESYTFLPPEEYRNSDSRGIFRPDGVPKQLRYDEIARFYSEILDVEVDGKTLGSLREENPTLYANAIRTFAYVEAQLKEWRAVSFPYEMLVRRYL